MKMKGKHKNPIAAVYKLTNIITGKIYIGETSDLLNRITSHKGTPRRKSKYINTPIEKAVAKYGYESFSLELLVDGRDNPRIEDTAYRRQVESEYIAKYNSTDPDVGYNRIEFNNTHAFSQRVNYPTGRKNSKPTRLKLSKSILAYNHEDKSVLLYCSSATYKNIHGLSDRSIVNNAASHGRMIHGSNIFHLDYGLYKREVMKTIKRRIDNIRRDSLSKKTAKKYLKTYITAVIAVEEWRRRFGFKEIDISEILKDFQIDASCTNI